MTIIELTRLSAVGLGVCRGACPFALLGNFQRCPAMRLGKFPNKLRHFLSLKCKRQPLRFEAPPNLPPCGMDLPCTLAVSGGLGCLTAFGCLCRLPDTQVVVQVLVFGIVSRCVPNLARKRFLHFPICRPPCRVIVEETMDAPVTVQPVHGFADIGNGIQYDTVLVRQVGAVWLFPFVDGKDREIIHEALKQVANIVSSVSFLYMRYLFGSDARFEERVADFIQTFG